MNEGPFFSFFFVRWLVQAAPISICPPSTAAGGSTMSHQRPDADNESAPMLSRGGDEVAAQRADEEAFSGGSSSRKVGGGAGLYNNRQLRAPPSERWSPQRW